MRTCSEDFFAVKVVYPLRRRETMKSQFSRFDTDIWEGIKAIYAQREYEGKRMKKIIEKEKKPN